MLLKQKVYNHFLQFILEKEMQLQKILADLKESGSNETKSTAGDKHETALAMLQIEQANVRGQLNELLIQKVAFKKIKPDLISTVICTGSLIITSKGYFFLSVALGKVLIDGIWITAISPQSPLGQQLVGLTVNDVVVINNNRFEIENIL